MNLTPEMIRESQAVALKICKKLAKEFGVLLSKKSLQDADGEAINFIPLYTIAFIVATKSHALAASLRQAGNKNISADQLFNVICRTAFGAFNDIKNTHPIYKNVENVQ